MKRTRNRIFFLIPLVIALLAAMPAYAHHFMDGDTPTSAVEGFLSGAAHPLIGIDHFAFVLVVGLIACGLSGAQRFLVPLAFVAAALGGAAVHLAAANLPLSEIIIAVSIVMGGVLVATRSLIPVLLLTAGMAVFGIFHGYAYGESIIGAETGPLTSYLFGFSVVQYAIITGVVLGMEYLVKRSTRFGDIVAVSAGALATLIGGLFLAMNLSLS